MKFISDSNVAPTLTIINLDNNEGTGNQVKVLLFPSNRLSSAGNFDLISWQKLISEGKKSVPVANRDYRDEQKKKPLHNFWLELRN